MSRLRNSCVIAVAFFATPPIAASAQDSILLDEIVVDGTNGTAAEPFDGYVPKLSETGTKTATPLTEVPQSVAVIGATEIRDLGARSIVEATQYTSGVLSQTFGADTRNDWFLIRGFPAQVSGYFLDGLQLYSYGFSTFRIEPFGLERLEVLKGPASVLYGGSSTGGIVNAVSKVPPNAPHGSIETGIDNYGNKYAAFDVGGPVSPAPNNSLYYRVEGLARGGGTQVDYTPNDRLFVAPSIAWRPDADTSVTVLGQYQKDRTRGQNFLPYAGTVVAAPFGRIPASLFTSDPGYDTFQRDQALFGYQAEHRFNDTFTARQNLRYSDLRVDYKTLFGIGYDGDPANGELSRLNFIATPHVTEFAVDNQLEARFRTGAISHVALFGLDYKHYTLADNQGFSFGANDDLNLFRPIHDTGATAPSTRYILNQQTQDQVGEYVQEQARLGGFTLVLGGRHDQLRTSIDNELTPPASTASADGAFTGRAGLIYTTPQGFAPYATYATSFDPQLRTNGGTGKALVPMTGQLTEIGAKYEPIGRNILLTGALFDLVQNNVLTSDPANPLNIVQTGQERSRGFELQAQGNITPALSVLASYTGYRLRDTEDLNPALVGKVPVNTPRTFGSLLLDYTVQGGPLRGFGAGAGPRYVGGSYAENTNTYGVPSYLLADAEVHFEREHWRAQVNVTNVFDKTYVASCQTLSACFYGNRRTSLFSLAYRW